MREMTDKKVSPQEILLSNEITQFLKRKAKVISRRYFGNLRIKLTAKDKNVAYTDNSNLVVNVGESNEFLDYEKLSLADNLKIVYGLVVHECAHMLYTDFSLLRKAMESLTKGTVPSFLPNDKNEDIKSFLNTPGKEKLVRNWLCSVFGSLQNIIEDGHIERRIVIECPGEPKRMLAAMRRRQLEISQNLEEVFKKYEDNDFMRTQVLTALFLRYSLFNINSFNEKMFDTKEKKALFETYCASEDILRKATLQKDSTKRFQYTWDLFCSIFEYIKPSEEKLEEMAKMAEMMEAFQQAMQELGESGNGGNSSNSNESSSSKPLESSSMSSSSGGSDSKDGSEGSELPSNSVPKPANGSKKPETEKGSASSDSKEKSKEGSTSSAESKESSKESSETKKDESKGKTESKNNSSKDAKGSDSEEKGSKSKGKKSDSEKDQGEDSSDDGDYSDSASFNEAVKSAIKGILQERASKNERESTTEYAREFFANPESIVDHNIRVAVVAPDDSSRDGESYEAIVRRNASAIRRSKNRLEKVLKEEIISKRLKGNYVGEINTSQFIRRDMRYWDRKILPHEKSLAVGLLIDESGSMWSNERWKYAREAAIVLYEFCKALDVPVAIYGHTADNKADLELIKYKGFDHYNDLTVKKDLMTIKPRYNNRDSAANSLVCQILSERPERQKLFIVISDGRPAAYGYGGNAAIKDMQRTKKKYKALGVTTFAAAIGSDKKEIEKCYKDGFLDITDLSKLPENLLRLVKSYLQ